MSSEALERAEDVRKALRRGRRYVSLRYLVAEFENAEIALAALLADLAAARAREQRLASALRGSAWNDADGPCWCAESVEVTGRPHIERCLAARAALAAEPAAGPERVHRFTLGSAFEAIRRVLAWPPDASHEAEYANARKALNELFERFAECERKRYDAERKVERLPGSASAAADEPGERE